MNYVICDLDGCLSNDKWRRHLLPALPSRDYDTYHTCAPLDDIVPETRNEISYDIQGGLLLIVTGRPEKYRAVTERWLQAHGIEAALFMRPDGSITNAPTLKMHLVNVYFEGIHGEAWRGWSQVVSAYDDREDVLAAYPLSRNVRHLVVL